MTVSQAAPTAALSRRRLAAHARGAALAALVGLAGCGQAAPVRTSAPAVDPNEPPAVATYVAKGKTKKPDHLELPLRLLVPRIGIDARIIAVGMTADGAMDAPQHPEEIGWWQFGPRPGMQGNAVLAGHLDWYGVNGVFKRLGELGRKDTVIIRAANGEDRAYAVDWREEYPTDGAPVATVFASLETPALTLITCGGRWNAVARRYDARVVVRAAR